MKSKKNNSPVIRGEPSLSIPAKEKRKSDSQTLPSGWVKPVPIRLSSANLSVEGGVEVGAAAGADPVPASGAGDGAVLSGLLFASSSGAWTR